MTNFHSFHSLEAEKGPISFTFRHTHTGMVDTKSPPWGQSSTVFTLVRCEWCVFFLGQYGAFIKVHLTLNIKVLYNFPHIFPRKSHQRNNYCLQGRIQSAPPPKKKRKKEKKEEVYLRETRVVCTKRENRGSETFCAPPSRQG